MSTKVKEQQQQLKNNTVPSRQVSLPDEEDPEALEFVNRFKKISVEPSKFYKNFIEKQICKLLIFNHQAIWGLFYF